MAAFLVVRDGAHNAASCEGLRAVSMHDIRRLGATDASKVSIKIILNNVISE